VTGRLGAATALATSGLLALTLLQASPASAEEGNLPPVANPDSTTVDSGGVVTVDPLANDQDPDGDAFTVTAADVTTPGSGTVTTDGQVLVISTAAPFAGDMTVVYTVTDARGAVAQGTVIVTVTAPTPPPAPETPADPVPADPAPADPPAPAPPRNKRPVAVKDTATVTAGRTIKVKVLANDRDRDGDKIRLVKVLSTSKGKARKSGSKVRYKAPASFSGKVRITYRIRDARGASDKGLLKVKVKPKPRPKPKPARVSKGVPTRTAIEAALARLQLPGGVVNGVYDARTMRALCTWRTVTGRSAHRGLPSTAEARALVATKSLPKPRSWMVSGVNVSRTCQAAFWVSNNRNYRRIMPASTGMGKYATRLGTNRIFITHRTWRYSTLYPEARMYKPLQFDGGQAIHGSASDSMVKTYPASHGCVRMLHRDINALHAGGVGNGTWVKVVGAW